MFEIKFYNSRGTIVFGGGKSESCWRVIQAEGLALPGKTFKTATYSETDGVHTISEAVNSRTITLSGDTQIEKGYDYAEAVSILFEEGFLEITTIKGVRRIGAKCSSFVPGEKKGCYRLFTVQFICDYPYFEDCNYHDVPVYKTIPMLSNSFEFPGAFSERIMRSVVINSGSVKTEPIFQITAGDVGSRISIINHTSGESIEFDYSSLTGECITIDAGNRKIYSSNGENLLSYLTDDSFFDGFCLMPGENDIEVSLGENCEKLVVTCRFKNRYSEAVYV